MTCGRYPGCPHLHPPFIKKSWRVFDLKVRGIDEGRKPGLRNAHNQNQGNGNAPRAAAQHFADRQALQLSAPGPSLHPRL
jgi:hypothetical protein